MRHLARAELLAAAEGGPVGAAARTHLAACGACRDDVDALRAVAAALRSDTVPEPSPLFWTHFAGRVHDAVRADAARYPRRRVAPWPPLRWWASAGTLAAAVAGVLLLLLPPGAGRGPAVPAGSPGQVVAGQTNGPGEPGVAEAGEPGEDAWALVAAIAVAEPWQIEEETVVRAGAAEEVVAGLSDSEQAELAMLLRRELGDPTI